MPGEEGACGETRELWVIIYGLGVLKEPSKVRQIRLLVLQWEIT